MPDAKPVVCSDIDGKRHEITADKLRWRPSAYGIVLKDGKLLVSPQFHGYDLPGGGVELGETLEEALLREIREETGIVAGEPRLLGCETSFFKLPKSTTSIKSPYVQSLLFYYRCEYVSGKLSSDGFTEDEKLYSRDPEWLPLEKAVSLERSAICSSYDWRILLRPLVAHSSVQ
jgi:8-oxo-dGTP diphosphatase